MVTWIFTDYGTNGIQILRLSEQKVFGKDKVFVFYVLCCENLVSENLFTYDVHSRQLLLEPTEECSLQNWSFY